MRDYELVYIVSPQVVEESLTGVVEKVSQLIASRGGQIDRVDSWGKRRLAYPIASFREGTYVLTQFKMDPAQAPDLESSLRTSEEIIRHLVIRLDEAQVRQRKLQLAQQQEREEQEKVRREQAAAQAAQVVAAQAEAQAAAQAEAEQPVPEAELAPEETEPQPEEAEQPVPEAELQPEETEPQPEDAEQQATEESPESEE